MGYYIDAQGNYYQGDEMPGSIAVPERPSVLYDWSGTAWVANIPKMQAAKTILIQEAWEQVEQGGFTYLGKTIQSDPINVQRLTFAMFGAQAAIANSTTFSGSWLCADGTLLSLTATQVVAMVDTFALFGLNVYNHAQALFLQVQTATTSDQIDAIPNW